MKKFISAAIAIVALTALNVSAFADNTYSKSLTALTLESAAEPEYEHSLTEEVVSENSEQAKLYFSLLDGNGTEKSPYLIYDAEELFIFADTINSGSDTTCYFKLMDDIDLGGKDWTPVGYYTDSLKYKACFSGVFDGNGHTVSNFKITSAERAYVGFFGFIYNGTVKNLTLSDFELNVDSTFNALYAGAVVGRCISAGEGKNVGIENCIVKNGSINAKSSGSTYTGGIAGYVMSSDSASESYVKNCKSVVSVLSFSQPVLQASYSTYAGGLIGYTGATVDTVLTIENCMAAGDVQASTLDDSDYMVSGFAGGLTGFAGSSGTGSMLDISKCYTVGDVSSDCTSAGYVGGFSSYFAAQSGGTISVSDCYSVGDASGITHSHTADANYMCIGSFAGAATPSTSVSNFYSTGNAVDLGSEDSYVGALLGYNFGAVSSNCFYPEDMVIEGVNINLSGTTAVSVEDASDESIFTGFDFENTWKMYEEGYRYPTLSGITQVFKVTYMAAGKVYEKQLALYKDAFLIPEQPPSDYSDEQKDYVFSHWSLTEGGEAFDASAQSITDNFKVYAVFDGTIKRFDVEFVNDSEVYHKVNLEYGSEILPPESLPKKEADVNFWYRFERWSLTSDGSDKTPLSEITLNRDLKLYAIFEGIDHSVWNGAEAKAFSSGFGTQTRPYIISSGYELYYLALKVSEGDKSLASAYYELSSDIDLGENEWLPIGTKENPFSGVFNGCGYRITNYRLTEEMTYIGLFGYVTGANIGRILIENAFVNIENALSQLYASIVVGYACDKNEIYQVSAVDSMLSAHSGKSVYAGGIAGSISSSDGENIISDCYVSISIDAQSEQENVYVGYVAGNAESIEDGNSGISNCYALGSMSANAGNAVYAGGIAGYISSTGAGWSGWFSEGESSLLSTDDVVIHGSFAVGDIEAFGTRNAYAGSIAGGKNEHAIAEKCYYYSEMSLKVQTENSEGTVTAIGTSTGSDSFRSIDFLIDNLGFDFVSVWVFTDSYMYPELKIFTSDKPLFNVKSINSIAGTVSLNVQVRTFESESYNVVLSVYSERGRLIGIKTEKVEDNSSGSLVEFLMVKDNVRDASYIKITVVDSQSRALLFPAVMKEL